MGLRDAEVDGMYTITCLETFIMRARSSWVLDTVQNSTSTSTRDRDGRTLLAIKSLRHVPQWKGCVAFLLL